MEVRRKATRVDQLGEGQVHTPSAGQFKNNIAVGVHFGRAR